MCPRDGAGNFNLVSGNPVVSGTIISSTTQNNTMSDVGSALTQSLSKDGQTTPTANLTMGNFRHTNVAAAAARTDYAQAGQVQDSAMTYLTSVSGTDTIVASAVTPSGLAAYAAGQHFRFVAAGTNTTSAVTLNINGIGAKNVTMLGASTLQPGMIQSGAVVSVLYDGTQFQAIGINNGSNVVGMTRNLKMYMAAAGTTGTMTADELIAETALGGVTYKLSNFSQSINLSTTGAGGMDTGSAPVSGFVALYAIYNPTTGAVALLATTAASLVGNVYGGGSMPSGYTASALVAVWPTNASRQFVQGYQNDRKFSFQIATALSSTTTQASITTLGVSSIVPANAKTVGGQLSAFASATGAQLNVNLFVASIGCGNTSLSGSPGAASAAVACPYQIDLQTAQTMYYTSSISAGTLTYNITVNSYWI